MVNFQRRFEALAVSWNAKRSSRLATSARSLPRPSWLRDAPGAR